MTRLPQLGVLPEDGLLWMLVWLGPFFFEPGASQRGVLGFLAAVPGSAGKTPARVNRGRFPHHLDLSRVLRVEFSTGDLAALHPGMMFRNRKLVRNRRSLLSFESFTADFAQQSAFRLHERPDLTRENTLTGGAWPLLEPSGCVSLPTNGVELIIPATEVLRWCYGSSSRVLQAALSQELGELLRAVEQDGILSDGTYTMTLPQGFPAEDAPLLAWLTLDPAARKAALQVDLQIVVGKTRTEQGEFFFPKVRFPYTGQRQIACQGRYIGEQAFLVSRIIDLEFEPPFGQVYLRQASPGLPAGEGGEPSEGTRSQRRRVKNADSVTLHSGIEPEDNRSSTRLPGLSSQFTGLVPVLAEGIEGEEGPLLTPHFLAPPRHVSTGLGQDRGSGVSRAVLLASGTETPVNNEDFRALRAILPHLGLDHQELPINNPGGTEGRFRHLRKGNGQRVGCLVIQLSAQGQFFYLLEKERVTEQYGPLLLATRGKAATDAQLSALMDTWTTRRRWPKAVPGWHLTHIPHNYSSAENFAAGVRKRLALPG